MTDVGELVESFTTSVRFRSSETTLVMRGEVDLATAPQLRTLLLAVIEDGHRRPVLDCSGVRFMDCSGLAVLIEGSNRLAARGERLALRFLPTMLRRILRITEVDQLLTLEALPMAQHDESQDEPVNDADLADHVRRANAVPIRSEDVDAALRLVVAMALASVEGADGASVTLLRRGELRTVASSDETTTDLDGDQYALDSGPCVEASRYGQPVFAGSFDSNEQRWPDFVERARARGIAAMLSMPLVVDEVSIGAINVNSRVAGGLSTSSLAAAANVADEARIFLAAAGSDILDDRFRRRIQQALEERDLAAKALGVVMAREQIDEDAAFTVLRQLAASRDQSFREVTETVVASARPTEPVESERAP